MASEENEVVDRGDALPETSEAPEEQVVGDSLEPVVEEEAEETAEEKAERERLEAEEAKKRNIRIPKSRFDEAQAKARAREQALLEEINALKNGQQVSAVQKSMADVRAEIDTLQDKYEDLILDGRKDDARKVRKQIEAMRDELVEYHTTVKSDAARRAAIEDLSYNAQLASIEAKYPALNPDSEDFNEEQTSEVATLLTAFAKSGINRVEALAKAVKYVLGAPPEQKVSDAARAMAEERARKAREKAAVANGKQPPSSTGVGLNSDRIGVRSDGTFDVMKLSQEHFAKLDDDTKARLRGDLV